MRVLSASVRFPVFFDRFGNKDMLSAITWPARHYSQRVGTGFAPLPWMFATLSQPSAIGSTIPNQSILVVEDERASRRALTSLLRTAGYDIRAAESAEEALQLVATGSFPTIALVDLNLPGMDGLELIARLRALDTGVFAILITANDSQYVRSHLLTGCVDYLRKPINFEHLLQIIHDRLPNA
jgi:CheY-like chemotaxis protein